MKVGIVRAKFNEAITENLLKGAVDFFKNHNIDYDLYHVPGAFELPFATQQLALADLFDGLVCLGAVIRGETPHFDYVCQVVSHGIMEVSLSYDVPVTFGVLTTDTVEQAEQRSGEKTNNKGYEASKSLLDMIKFSDNVAQGD